MKLILAKYVNVKLSKFEMFMVEQEYKGYTDDAMCRYTDLYSDVMTASLEEEGGGRNARASDDDVISANLAGNELDRILSENDKVVVDNVNRELLSRMDFTTPLNMARAFMVLAESYVGIGDLANAEALNRYSIMLAQAVESSTDRRFGLMEPGAVLEAGAQGVLALGAVGHSMTDLDDRLTLAREELQAALRSYDAFAPVERASKPRVVPGGVAPSPAAAAAALKAARGSPAAARSTAALINLGTEIGVLEARRETRDITGVWYTVARGGGAES